MVTIARAVVYVQTMAKQKRRTISADGFFDLECASWSTPVVGVTCHRRTGVVVHTSARSLVEEMLRCGGTWWSHNGGTYDSLAAAEQLRQLGVSATFSLSGSRISRAQGAGLTICDSWAVCPLPLGGLAGMAGLEAPSLDLPCDCGEECGGYCSIRTRMPESQLERLTEYCVADCEAGLAGIDALAEFAAREDYDLRGTVGGAAWATAQRWLELPDATLSPATWKRVRQAYHGGRCTVFRPRDAGPGAHWDITSAYPAALASASLPVGEPTEHGAREARARLGRGAPGVYACTVDVPDMLVPPLPWVTRNATAYPHGRVSGVWSLPDLESAIDLGCTIVDVSWSVTWPREENVFGAAIDRWTATRARYRGTPFYDWCRLFNNSLLGKLGEAPTRRFVRMHPPQRDIRVCLGQAPCRLDRCTGACGAYHQLDMWGQMWSVPYYRLAKSGHVHWAAYGNALTRATLNRALTEQGDDVVYCDTDSVWTRSDRVPSEAGDGPGQWVRKHGWSDWHAAAQKSYAFVNGETGEPIVRSAGMKLKASDWQHGEAEQKRGVLTLLDAAKSMTRGRRGLFRAKTYRWTMPASGMSTGWYGDRMLDPVTGVTHPVTCEDLRRKEAESDGRRA